eukprot:1161352-Pelagomonas_calceolata.AAC.9
MQCALEHLTLSLLWKCDLTCCTCSYALSSHAQWRVVLTPCHLHMPPPPSSNLHERGVVDRGLELRDISVI